MVGIVVVSHSDALAAGVVRLAREMAGGALMLEPAGGIEEPGVLGTDAERVRAAVERAMSPDGVLVLMDLGSALLSAELAIELLGSPAGPVQLSSAALVEGTVAAAVAASGGASLQEVAAEARGALAMKGAQLDIEAPDAGAVPASDSADQAPAAISEQLPVLAAVGLHARPAARLVATARAFDAEVSVAKAPGGRPVRASSMTGVVSLGARWGDTLLISAAGPQAREALDALRALAADGFGDGVAAGPPPANHISPAPEVAVEQASQAPAQPPSAGAVLSGVAASRGLAVGSVHLLHGGAFDPPAARAAERPERERARLQAGIDAASEAIRRDRESVARRAGAAEAEIMDAHLALLDDEAMREPAYAAIDGGASAERAFYDAAVALAARYRGFDQPLLQERAIDVLDVGRRVVRALSGEPAAVPGAAGIVVAGELTPADAAALDPKLVQAIATAHGTATAHAAILARALDLPAVVGLGESVLLIPEGTLVLLDGDLGSLQVDPPAELIEAAQTRRRRAQKRTEAARARARELATTRDGVRIEVFANLGSSAEASRAVELGAEGVGLLRTEFLFLARSELPGEEEQAQTLIEIARALQGRPLIVRTLDAGADKPLPALPMPKEANPFLGVRGIRLGLARPEVLETQFRAILRAARQFPLWVMLPMVATAQEIEAARAVLVRARAHTGIDVPLPLGIMVEIPAAAVNAAELAEHAEFFSIGTNDLTQYTMAAQRGDERLATLLSGPQPAVLRLISATVQGAAARGRTVGVCGELAGDPAAALLLVGLGVTELSMTPPLIPDVKMALRQVDLATARRTAQAALVAEDASAARALSTALL
ncbi:MAG: phosphoenolpyruvate--protein phosphotransferase [Solirubrobacteraceae bacterium]